MSENRNQNHSEPTAGSDAMRIAENIAKAARRRRVTLTDRAHLQLAEKKFNSVMAVVNDGVITFDEFGIIETYNAAAEKIFGYSAEEIIGRSFGLLVPNPQSSQTKDGKGCGPIAVKKDNSEIQIELGVTKLEFGQEKHFIGIVRDASLPTSKSGMGQTSSASSGTATATATDARLVLHVDAIIRDELNSLMRDSECLTKQNLSDECSQAVNNVRGNATAVLSFCDRLTEYVQLEAGEVTAQRAGFSPVSLLEELEGRMQTRAQQKGIAFQIECKDPLPATARSHPKMLKKILVELISNAVDCTPSGTVRLKVHLAEEDSNSQRRLCFEVIDEGPGVPDALVGCLFEPFVRDSQDAPAEDAQSGRRQSGLGLSIAQKLAELLGGEIAFQNLPDSGSSFSFSIDAGEVDRASMVYFEAKTSTPSNPEPAESDAAEAVG